MTTTRGGRGRFAAPAAILVATALVLGLAACASGEGANRALADGMVTSGRDTARTPADIDFNRPAWRRDWTPAGDP